MYVQQELAAAEVDETLSGSASSGTLTGLNPTGESRCTEHPTH